MSEDRDTPMAQIGWADEFGNLFPMGAWKPAQRTWRDSHKTAWRPVFLHPPAEVQRLQDAATRLVALWNPATPESASAVAGAINELRRVLDGGDLRKAIDMVRAKQADE